MGRLTLLGISALNRSRGRKCFGHLRCDGSPWLRISRPFTKIATSRAIKDASHRPRSTSLREIGRAFGKFSSSIHFVVSATGGFAPRPRRRRSSALTLSEREEISRALAQGRALRAIATALGRAPSTISREVARCGGRLTYRAASADERAWTEARRPQACLLARNARLRRIVAQKLAHDWSPEQISGWLVRA